MKTILAFLLLTSCAGAGQAVRDSLLRQELLAREAADQEVRRIHFTEKLQQGLKLSDDDVHALNDVDSFYTTAGKAR